MIDFDLPYNQSNKYKLISSLEKYFVIQDYYLTDSDGVESRIDKSSFNKENFVKIKNDIKPLGYIPILHVINNEYWILIKPINIKKTFRIQIPLILFILVIITVSIDGWYRSIEFGVNNPFNSTLLYVAGLLGIIGIHELGHKIAAAKHNMYSSLPYFIPGIPVIALPTFGALIISKEPLVNRDALFDLGISGPIAGLLVTIIVAIQGASTSKFIPNAQAELLLNTGNLIELQSSPLMSWIFDFINPGPPDTTLILSPLAFAAWLGFFITFLNLIPAAQLDGGHIARATLGVNLHRLASYVSIGLLIFLGYWPMAFIILFMMMRTADIKPLDDKSSLSQGRKLLFIMIIILAVLCSPIPIS